MDRRAHRSHSLIAVFAMIFAIFVVVPAIEAMTCSGEVFHSASVAAGAPDVHGDGGDIHGLCAHGHCHLSYARLDQQAPELARFVRPPAFVLPADARRGYFPVTGPDRPPRA